MKTPNVEGLDAKLLRHRNWGGYHAPRHWVLFTPEGHENRIGTFVNGSLACDNVERTYEELTARGVSFTAPPQKQEWGTFATFRDPDGNEFVLSSR